MSEQPSELDQWALSLPPPPQGYPAWPYYCDANPSDQFCLDNVPSHYESIPYKAANIAFAAIFSLSTISFLVTYFIVRRRRGTFFTVVMILGCITEVIGYVARVMSSDNPWQETGFLMQIVCLTIGPAFLAAGIYSCLAKLVLIYGESNSRLKAAWYTRIFIPCDFISLVLQAVGGALASMADDQKTLDLGTNIMIAGLVWQVFTLVMFIACCVDFFFRVKKLKSSEYENNSSRSAHLIRSSKMFKGFLYALAISTLTILWRSGYRVAELSEGFDGPLMAEQDLFIGFESVMILVSVLVLNVFHPSICLGEAMDNGFDGGQQIGQGKSEVVLSSGDSSEMAVLQNHRP
ncbi:RTA1 like protein-domain-containing protein [Podospora fimiseda]|uniref:RTA1 like protein-domain-containing protein n=1 Tax=Podospora fimiseda TaxID=252190 RepID=A0AAN7GYH7_9PEZI|nr:RTA1 like protein-domain-containing protein [Podospora fimiseda]